MSILLAQNTAGLLSIANFFSSAAGVPITLAFSIKMDSLPTSGSNVFEVLRIDGGTGWTVARVSQSAGTVNALSAQTNDGAVSSSTSVEKFPMAGQWVKCVCVFNSNTNKIVYSLDGSGNLMTSATGTSSRPASGEVNLKLLSTWASGAVRVNNLTIYRGVGLTSSQAKELMDTDSVAGIAPYAKWDTTSAWSGNILDISGNGRHITPPGTWSHSSDNPSFVTDENDTPVIGGVSMYGVQFSYASDDSEVVYSAVKQPANGSLSISGNIATYSASGSFAGSDSFSIQADGASGKDYSTIVLINSGDEIATPDSFSFGDVSGSEISTITYSASQVTLSGMTPGVNVSAVPSGGLQYRVSSNGGASFGDWLSVASNVQNGYVIEVALVSSPSYSTNVSGALTVGGVAGSFSVTTESEYISPTIGDNSELSARPMTARAMTVRSLSAR